MEAEIRAKKGQLNHWPVKEERATTCIYVQPINSTTPLNSHTTHVPNAATTHSPPQECRPFRGYRGKMATTRRIEWCWLRMPPTHDFNTTGDRGAAARVTPRLRPHTRKSTLANPHRHLKVRLPKAGARIHQEGRRTLGAFVSSSVHLSVAACRPPARLLLILCPKNHLR